MPIIWTLNCFLGCIYTVYHIVYIVFLVLNWLSNLEFWRPKKRTKLPELGSRGGSRWFLQWPKQNVFCIDVFPYGIYHDYYDQRQDAGRRHGMIVCYGNDNHFTRTKDDVMTRGGSGYPQNWWRHLWTAPYSEDHGTRHNFWSLTIR